MVYQRYVQNTYSRVVSRTFFVIFQHPTYQSQDDGGQYHETQPQVCEHDKRDDEHGDDGHAHVAEYLAEDGEGALPVFVHLKADIV